MNRGYKKTKVLQYNKKGKHIIRGITLFIDYFQEHIDLENINIINNLRIEISDIKLCQKSTKH